MQSETMIPDRELTRALQVCLTSITCLLRKFQVADHVFVYYTNGSWELELHFHLTSHSRCPWASPLRGSWWRTPSPRRSSPATPSPSTRWASRFCPPVNEQQTISRCHGWGRESLTPNPLQAFTSQFHRVKIQQASARAGEAEPERNETRKKVSVCHQWLKVIKGEVFLRKIQISNIKL